MTEKRVLFANVNTLDLPLDFPRGLGKRAGVPNCANNLPSPLRTGYAKRQDGVCSPTDVTVLGPKVSTEPFACPKTLLDQPP